MSHASEIAAGDRFAFGKNWRSFLDRLDDGRIWPDWLGGSPFKVARRKDVVDFFHREGFHVEKLNPCGDGWANNEFILRAPAAGSAESA